VVRRVHGLRVVRPFALDPHVVTKVLRAHSVLLSINAVYKNFKPLLEREGLPLSDSAICVMASVSAESKPQAIRNLRAQEAGG
jgi:hypothetical protein